MPQTSCLTTLSRDLHQSSNCLVITTIRFCPNLQNKSAVLQDFDRNIDLLSEMLPVFNVYCLQLYRRIYMRFKRTKPCNFCNLLWSLVHLSACLCGLVCVRVCAQTHTVSSATKTAARTCICLVPTHRGNHSIHPEF